MADDGGGRGRPLKPPPGKKAGRAASQEERELWEHTAASLQPVEREKGPCMPRLSTKMSSRALASARLPEPAPAEKAAERGDASRRPNRQ